MTRAQQIETVKRQIALLPLKNRKQRSILEARLRALMTRQLKAENRKPRKEAA